jgi:hypothetical protein
MRRFKSYVAALALSALVGCSGQGADGPAAIERAAIVNGMLSSPQDDAVVSIQASGNGCTGSLIAPTVVLTALHCVAEYDPRFRFNCEPDGSLPPGATIGQLGELVDPRGITVTVGIGLEGDRVRAKSIFGTGSTDACHDDLAVVVLERAPDIGDAPLVSLRFSRPTRKGEMTRVVGYGDVGQTDTMLGRQVRSDVLLRGVGGPDASTPGDTGVLPRTVMVGEGPCHGDSGGPLFSQETGAQIGVYSLLQQSTCAGPSTRNTYTQVQPFEALIREALESEGAEPLLEPEEPEPTGAGGEAGAASQPSGGSVGVGGTASGGSGATGEMPSEAGAAPTDPGNGSTGRGRYKDSSCSYRGAGQAERSSWVLGAALILAGCAARRRRSV